MDCLNPSLWQRGNICLEAGENAIENYDTCSSSSWSGSERIQYAKYNRCIQRIEQPPLAELINIPKAGPVCGGRNMPITCRRTVINANTATVYVSVHVHTNTNTHAPIDVQHMHNTCAKVHATVRFWLIRKGHRWAICIVFHWIHWKIDIIATLRLWKNPTVITAIL